MLNIVSVTVPKPSTIERFVAVAADFGKCGTTSASAGLTTAITMSG